MKALVFTVILTFLSGICSKVSSGETNASEIRKEDAFLRSSYKAIDAGLKGAIKMSTKLLLSEFLEVSQSVNLSSSCLRDSLRVATGVRNLKQWAIRFLDASGKVNDGFFSGNAHMLGNYDQCLSSKAEQNYGSMDFQGKYCLVSYNPLLPDPKKTPDLKERISRTQANTRNLSEIIHLYITKSQEFPEVNIFYGLCVPSGCSQTDVENLMEYVGDKIQMNLMVKYCHIESDTYYFSTKKIVIMCIFIFFGVLGILGSMTEYHSRSNSSEYKGIVAKLILSFAITKNFPRLINTNTSDEKTACIHGIRILSIFYVIICHTYALMGVFTVLNNNVPNMIDYIPTFFFQIALNGFLNVETLFFVSGFLNIYVRLQKEKEGMRLTWWKILLRRILRMYPVYISSLLLLYLLTPRGPLSMIHKELFQENCNDTWWKNFLFINNFFGEKVCLPHSWYIAVDMQLFLISLITIPILSKSPKKGVILTGCLIILSLMATAIFVYVKKTPPAFLFEEAIDFQRNLLLLYFTPFNHAASYFLGVLMGHFLSSRKDIEISKTHQIIGWLLASFLFTSALFMTYRWNSGIKYTIIESVIYSTFSKPLYIVGVGWMMFCCLTGHGGIINYILSLKLWIPLSRISFALYLVSFVVQIFYRANMRTPADAHWMIWIWRYFGDLCTSCLLALVITLLAESPIAALEKLSSQDNDADKKAENLDILALKNTNGLHTTLEKQPAAVNGIHSLEK